MDKEDITLEKLVKKGLKLSRLDYNYACKKMEKEASKQQKQEIFNTGMKKLRKTLKKYTIKQMWDMIKLTERMASQFKMHSSTRKKNTKCKYSKKYGMYINSP